MRHNAFYLIAIVVLLLSCKSKKSQNNFGRNLDSLVISFIDSIKSKKLTRTDVTVYTMYERDTIFITLINAYPDLIETKFNGFEYLSGYNIYYVGDSSIKAFKNIQLLSPIPKKVTEDSSTSSKPPLIEHINVEPLVTKFYMLNKEIRKVY